MDLVFIYGSAAAGKYTVGKALSDQTGLPLFHNHLVVDAVASLFPFGSPDFIRLRERWWMDAFEAAAAAKQSLIFTFLPESSVAPDFVHRVQSLWQDAGGHMHLVRLTVPLAEQELRIDTAQRAQFGKLRSLDLLRELRDAFDASEAAMPQPDLTLDTSTMTPEDAAAMIQSQFNLSQTKAP